MTNKEVAQAFAKGETKGKSLHMFIDGNTVYSYGKHFPIATHVGVSKVLFTSMGYSSSTARHKSLVKNALLEKGFILEETNEKYNSQLAYPQTYSTK